MPRLEAPPANPKVLTRKELAVLYFPDVAPRTATEHLRQWYRRCKPLQAALRLTGYTPQQRTFTPRQVQLFYEYLGEP